MLRDDGVVAAEIVPPSGTVTFLFTDVEGSTRLWEEHPAEMGVALARHDELVRSAIAGRDGYVFATGGDGFAAAFGRAEDAVAAAVDAQRALGEEGWPDSARLRVRMGVHSGEAEERDGDYFGAALNRIGRLHAAAHGGQIVVSDTTEPLVRDAVALRDMGSVRLRDLGRPLPVFQVLADGIEAEFPSLRSLDSLANNLPLLADELVGRSAEVSDVVAALASSRLVTLTGVGGTGKTRLALEVAARVAPEFDDGVWLTELAPVGEPGAVGFVVADVVGAVQQSGEPVVESLVTSLRHRELLLVLDNCEHLLDEVAELVEAIMASCAGVRVLATSREGLALRGEHIVAVPSLGPGEGASLFALRAQAAGAEVEAGDAGVVELVERLDGLPLAIELAAARAASLTVEEITERLDERFRLLRGRGRGRLERHQTLWNTVAWSYQLLEDIDQVVFERLSVFAGGFTLDAASAVCSDESLDLFDVEDAVLGLVDRSLVVAEQRSWGSRYRLLETVRQFAEAQLAERSEIDDIQSRHAEWYAEFAERAWEGIRSPEAVQWNRRQRDDIDNLRVALYTADLPTARRIAAAAAAVAWFRLDHEVLEWVLHVLEPPDHDDPAWMQSALRALTVSHASGDATARSRILRHLPPERITEPVDELWWLRHALLDTAMAGEHRAGLPQRLLDVAAGLDDECLRARWIAQASIASVIDGDLDVARQAWELHDDPAVWDRYPLAEAGCSFGKGRYLAAIGDHAAALDHFDRGLAISRQLDWASFVNTALGESAWMLVELGDLDRAATRMAEAIRAFVRAGDNPQLWTVLHHVVHYYITAGDEQRATQLWEQLQGRSSYTSPVLVETLSARLGEQTALTDSDEDLVARSLDFAVHLSA